MPLQLHWLRRLFWPLFAASALLAAGVLGSESSASRASARRSVPVAVGLRGSPLRRPTDRWIAGWSASPEPATPRISFASGFRDQTVRNIVFSSAGGRLVRVQFSNVFGQRPLLIGRAAIAQALRGANVVARSDIPLRFGGRPSVVISPGVSVMSDPVRLAVHPYERLAISAFLPHETGGPTDHARAKQTNYVAAGDHVLADPGSFTAQTQSWYFTSAVDVWSSNSDHGTVVAFGDSITDGVGSETGANARWPNDLARRLGSVHRPRLSVVDAGIAGNQVLSNSPCCGPSGLARFSRDVLGQSSVRAVIVLEGINDIGAAHRSAQQIIAGYRQLIARAHSSGVKIFGGTLTPFQGARYWTPAGEAQREKVNAWILHSGAFDGVINFAAAVADPLDPERFAPLYDSGDHLHPNDAGYVAMARAVNLSMLLSATKR